MLSLFFAQSFKSYGHFLDHVVEITLSLRHVEKRGFFSGKTNAAIRTASGRTSRLSCGHVGGSADWHFTGVQERRID